MKRNIFFLIIWFTYSAIYAQVGINTETPKASLDIHAQTTDSRTADGLIVPRLTLSQLVSKDALYSTDQTGCMVYITKVVGVTSPKTRKIIAPGYYSFDGAIWHGLTPDQNLRFFYMPSIVLPVDTDSPAYNTSTQTYTINLYQSYADQFGLTNLNKNAQKSPSATSLPVLQSNAFEYLITYFDDQVFKKVSVTNAGVLTYQIPTDAVFSEKTFMNVIFKLK